MSYQPGRLIGINYAALNGAVLSANTGQAGDFEPAWLADPDPDLYWRTNNGVTSSAIILTLDRARPVNAVAVCAHNLSTKATVTAILKVNGNVIDILTQPAHRPTYGFGLAPGFGLMGFGGTSLGDIEVEPLWPYTDLWFDELGLSDEVRIAISDPDNADGHLQVQYLHVGQYWSPAAPSEGEANNFEWGYRCEFEPNPRAIDTPDGATLVDHARPKRIMRANWRFLADGDQVRLNQLLAWAQNTSTPMFWSGYPSRGGAMEQQHLLLAHPIRWSGPTDDRTGGTFELQLREVYWHG